MATSSAPEFPYPGGTPGDEPADPVAGKPGHFAWSRWIKQFVKNLDANVQAMDAMRPWLTVATWNALPTSGNWLGRKVQVTGGLGLCVAMWNGSIWVVAPESDTGWRAATLINGATGYLEVRRIGYNIESAIAVTGPLAYGTPMWTPGAGWLCAYGHEGSGSVRNGSTGAFLGARMDPTGLYLLGTTAAAETVLGGARGIADPPPGAVGWPTTAP